MNPLQRNKVDLSAMSEQDRIAFQKYGKLPAKNVLTQMKKDRKYFDSGDYMMSKAGVQSAQAPGTAIPTPEGVPHASPPNERPMGLSASPTNNVTAPSPGLDSVSASANVNANANANERHSPLQSVGSGSSIGSGVGVGISPAATSEAIEMPRGAMGHARRGSESQSRTSPPGTLREHHSSSFVIGHGGAAHGSSPVKTSALANRVDEGAE